MGRKKVTMELIQSRSGRALTYKKRKASLFKKATELSTLCGIDVCLAVSNGPDDPAPEVWPSQEVMTKMVSQANVQSNKKLEKKLARQVAEMQLELQRQEEQNLDLQAKIVLEDALSGSSSVAQVASPEIAMRLSAMADARMKEVQDRINRISISSKQTPSSAAPGMVHLPLIGPEAGECVVPPTELPMMLEGVAGYFDPSGVASLSDGCAVDKMPGLFDIPDDLEEFFDDLPMDIADRKGIDDVLASALRGLREDDGDMEIETTPSACVVPATEQSLVPEGIAGSSDPSGVASLPDECVVDAIPGLLDIPEDIEQYFDGLPVDIAEWKGIDDALAPFLWGREEDDRDK